MALGGVLLLKNLEIINISWDIFWGTVWAAGFVLSGLVNIFNYRNKTAWIWGLIAGCDWHSDWLKFLRNS